MDPTSHPVARSDQAPAANGGPGEPVALPAKGALDTALLLLPVPRHTRPSDAEVAETGPLASARFIRFTIVFTVLFVLGMTTIIWYRWRPVTLPSSSVEFIGDESVDGAVLTVSRKGQESYSVTLDKKDDYTGAVWLSVPGTYDLVVSRNNEVLNRESIKVDPMQSRVLTLSAKSVAPAAPATVPATQPGAG